MKGLRIIAALLCAVMLAVPAMADDWDFGITEPDDHPTVETPAAPEPPAQETVSDPAASDPEPPAGPERDDNLWGDWKDPGNSGVRTELPSEAQQELEEARRELEEKQQQRDEAFREAERENAALPEEEEKQKKPAGSKAADAAPHRAGAAPAGSENRQPGAVHPHRGAAGRGPLHCHLPVYPPGAGGRPRR